MSDPYGQCKFPDTSGHFPLKNLMRGSLWQVDDALFQPVKPMSGGACAQASPIGAFKKNLKVRASFDYLYIFFFKRL